MTDYSQYHNSVNLPTRDNTMAFQQNQYPFDKNVSVSSTFDGNVCYQAPQRQAYNPNSTILEPIAFQDQLNDSYAQSTNCYGPATYTFHPQHVANYSGCDAMSGTMQPLNFRDSYISSHPPNKVQTHQIFGGNQDFYQDNHHQTPSYQTNMSISGMQMRTPTQQFSNQNLPPNKGIDSNFQKNLAISPCEDTQYSWTFPSRPETPSTASDMSKFSCFTSQEDIAHTDGSAYAAMYAMPYGSNFEINQAEKMMSKLVKLLHSEDHVEANVTAAALQKLSKNEVVKLSIIKSPHFLESILHKINITSDPILLKSLSGILYNLSNGKQERLGVKALYEARVIPTLIKLLSSNVENILKVASAVLHSILLHQAGSEADILEGGGVNIFLILLRGDNVKLLTLIMDCLRSLLISRREEVKNNIISSGGVGVLIRIMKTFTQGRLLRLTTSVFRRMSHTCKQARLSIVAAGGISALAQHLGSSCQKIVRNVLWTLRNISDSTSQAEPMEHVIEYLVKFLAVNDEGILACTAEILVNFTGNNQNNKISVYENRGVWALINVLAKCFDKDAVTKPIVCTLCHLTSRHPREESVQNDIRTNRGLPLVISLLQSSNNWSLAKATLNLIRNLSLCPGNKIPLREHQAAQAMVQVLMNVYQDTQKPYIGATHLENKEMEKVMEAGILALSAMSNDLQVKVTLCGLNQFVQILNDLQQHSNKNIGRNAARLLSELPSNSLLTLLPSHGISSSQKFSFDCDHTHGTQSSIISSSSENWLTNELLERPVKIQKIAHNNQYKDPISSTSLLNIGRLTKTFYNFQLYPGHVQSDVNNIAGSKDLNNVIIPAVSQIYSTLDPSVVQDIA